MMSNDFQPSKALKLLQAAVEEALERHQSERSDESLAKFHQAHAKWERALEAETFIHESQVPEKVLITDPTWRRWQYEGVPRDFPEPKEISGHGRCYSLAALRRWEGRRVELMLNFIEPRQLPPPRTHAPNKTTEVLRKMGIVRRQDQQRLTEMSFEERWADEIHEMLSFMNQEISRHHSNQLNSRAERDGAKRLLALMRQAKTELAKVDELKANKTKAEPEGRKISIKLRMELKRAGFNVDRFSEICERHSNKPVRGAGRDAFEKRIAAKYARILLERAGHEQKIAKTRGGPCAKLAAILYGDPDADLSRYCSGRASANRPLK